MKTTVRTIFVAGVVVFLSVGSALATSNDQQARAAVADKAVAWVTDANRESVANAIADRWAGEAAARGYDLGDWRQEYVANLLRLSNSRLAEARQSETYGSTVEIVTGKEPDFWVAGGNADVDPALDLTEKFDGLAFTGITPCRILDTRFGTGTFAGLRTSGSTTTISTRLTASIDAQGGNASGCPLPGVDPGAIAYTVTIVDYSGNGYVAVFPATATRPNASTLNFNPGTAPTPLANSSVVQQCYSCGDNTDISFYVAGGTTNVIVDVIGYYDPPPPTTCTDISTAGLTMNDTCQNYLSCSLTNTLSRSRRVICSAVVTPTINHTVGIHDESFINIGTATTTCGAYTTPGIGYLDVGAVVPSGCCFNQSTSGLQTFTLAKGATQIYYLNALRFLGTGTSLVSGSLRCTMVD